MMRSDLAYRTEEHQQRVYECLGSVFRGGITDAVKYAPVMRA